MKKAIIITLLIPFISLAQDKTCVTNEYESILIKENPKLIPLKEKQNKNYLNYIEKIKTLKTSSEQIIHIPVVFHIVYKTSNQNIPDSRIFEQMDQLNLDFSGSNSDTSIVPLEFKPFIANTNIRFYLATEDPFGNPTTGITRTQTNNNSFSHTNLSLDIKKTVNGGIDSWPTSEYLNIWVGNITSNVLGYSTLPVNHGEARDGVVLGYQFVGYNSSSSYDKGRTAVHEIGHYLGLEHIWGPGSGGCSIDDGINDTPIQKKYYTGTPTHPQTSCGSNDMFMNYMDYCYDQALVMFTNGQKDKMEYMATSIRTSLITLEPLGSNVRVENKLLVYPNPVTDVLNVKLKGLAKSAVITIVNTNGQIQVSRTVKNNFQSSFNISHLNTGVYFVNIVSGDEVYREKIIICH